MVCFLADDGPYKVPIREESDGGFPRWEHNIPTLGINNEPKDCE